MLRAPGGEAPMTNTACTLTRGWILWALVLLATTVDPSSAEEAPGTAPAPPPTVLVATGAKQPSVAVGPDGAIHVAMLMGGNIVVATSMDGGKTFGEPAIAIDAAGSARGGAQRGPRIGADGKGRLFVTAFATFDVAERSKRYPAADLYLVSSTDAGRTWTPPARVNEVEKKAPESLHSLAVSASGAAFVAWLDRRDRKTSGQDLWIAQIDGAKIGPNRKVAEQVCECCAPGLALDATGNPFLAWREGVEQDSREVVATRSIDGGKTFSKPQRVNRKETKEDG